MTLVLIEVGVIFHNDIDVGASRVERSLGMLSSSLVAVPWSVGCLLLLLVAHSLV